MLLSEFSGANKALKGFLEFNPFNVYSNLKLLNPPSIDFRILNQVRLSFEYVTFRERGLYETGNIICLKDFNNLMGGVIPEGS